ncbi:MAG: GNAT family N-acetyltransferase [Woeseiaceae bacterium]
MLQTDRLILSHLSYADCAFIIELLNEPSFLEFIGDRGVRNADDAREYLKKGAIDSYEKHGFGLYRVTQRDTRAAIGMCGLVLREEFDHPDLGFAFLERYWSNGYAYESAVAVLRHARDQLGLAIVIAMADEDNTSSIALLDKLGFRFAEMVTMPGEAVEICQFNLEFRQGAGP